MQMGEKGRGKEGEKENLQADSPLITEPDMGLELRTLSS